MNTTINKNQNATGANCGDGSNGKPLELESVLIISQAAALSKPLLPQSYHAALVRHAVQKNAYGRIKAGYNQTSLKSRQYAAPDNGGFVLPSNSEVMRSHKRSCTRTALGVLVSGNAPAVLDGESTPAFTGGFQFSNQGGRHG